MERHIRKHVHERKGTPKTSSGWFTTVVILASVALIGVMIYLSPLGPIVQEHVIDPIASFLGNKQKDSDIVSALKAQDEQAKTPAPTPSATPNPIQKAVQTVQQTPYYILQMGTYLDKASADEHALQLRQMGAAGYVYQDGSVYRVFAAAYTDAESLTKVQAQVRADGFEATPYITEQNAVKITLEGSDVAIQDAAKAIEFLSSVPDALCKMSLSYDRTQITDKDVDRTLQALIDQAEGILQAFQTRTQGEMLKPVLSVIQKYSDHISTFLNERDTISENEASGALKRLQIELIIDYIQFFDQK